MIIFWILSDCLYIAPVPRASRFHIDMISAVYLDQAMPAAPVIFLLVVFLVTHTQRSVVCEFVPVVVGMAWRRHYLSFTSMLTLYGYGSKNGQAHHSKAPISSSHYSSKLHWLLLRTSRYRA